MAQSNPIVGDIPAATHPAAAAYEQLLPQIKAVPESELVPINIDVITAVSTVLGALPEIRALRSEIDATWRRFDLERFDKLEQYTLALHHANALWRGASTAKADLPELASELTSIRDLLLKNAEALASFELIDGERLKECKTQPGYRPLATDVATIVELIRGRWSVVEGKSPLTLPQLNEFAGKSLTLLTSVGLKEQSPVTTGEAAEIRQRAFVIFLRAYEDARRAVLYLRPEQEEADEIAPSLYANRVRRKPNAEEPAAGSPDSEVVKTQPGAGEKGEDRDPQFNNAAGLPIDKPFTN